VVKEAHYQPVRPFVFGIWIVRFADAALIRMTPQIQKHEETEEKAHKEYAKKNRSQTLQYTENNATSMLCA